ncbi:uncharacterized protein LOC128811474 [Vidua macroura]|uniref:uncharacterized protein LOC128811474 n=1 Tax=Vidua macroura TaxID=187451 RepID=UPI0023A7FE8A|nr:uncharacterized protein LOC128811474 [Vidua macroura]
MSRIKLLGIKGSLKLLDVDSTLAHRDPGISCVMDTAGTEEQPFPELEKDCLLQRLAEEKSGQKSQSSAEERPPRPLTHRAWEEPCKLQPCTEQGPAEPRRSHPQRTTPAGPDPLERCRVPSPSLDRLEELGLWAGPAVMALLGELGSEERHWSDDCQDWSAGEESLSQSASNDPNKLESYRDPGQLLKLFLQDTDQSVSHGEDRKTQEWWLKKRNDICTHTIWVNPLYPALVVEPGSLEAEEADSDLPSTSPAPAAPTDTQPAAAALARAPEDEEQQNLRRPEFKRTWTPSGPSH